MVSYAVLDCSDRSDLMYLLKRRQRWDNSTGQLSFQLGHKVENPGALYCHNYLLHTDLLVSLLMELLMIFVILLLFRIKLSILKTVTRNEVTKIHWLMENMKHKYSNRTNSYNSKCLAVLFLIMFKENTASSGENC